MDRICRINHFDKWLSVFILIILSILLIALIFKP